MKGRKVTPKKNFQAECFMTVSREGLTRETLANTTDWHDSSASSHVLLIWLFCNLASRELLAKSTDSSFKLESLPT